MANRTLNSSPGAQMRRWLKPLWVLLALLFLFEAWLWEKLQRAVAPEATKNRITTNLTTTKSITVSRAATPALPSNPPARVYR